ncbi:esterase/lipase family protein [Geodermatophilus sp. URMC 64]
MARDQQFDRVSHALAAVLGLLLVAAVLAGTRPAVAASCDTGGLGRQVPVLLVHGFRSKGEHWNKELYPRGKELPGAPNTFVVPPFDYHGQSTQWIQNNPDSMAALELAEHIECLAKASTDAGGPGKVALVGHSMGGLLIRCALTPSCSHGPDVAAAAGQVVTIGTPNLGSILRPGPEASEAENLFGRTVQAVCAAKRAGVHLSLKLEVLIRVSAWAGRPLCQLVDELFNSSAGQAFVESKGEPAGKLADLPQWPAGVHVRTLAADIRFTYQVVLWQLPVYSVGDAVVGLDSARYGASNEQQDPLGGSRVVDCGAIVLNAVSLPPTCTHVTETSDARFAAMVAEAIRAWIPTVVDPCSGNEAFAAVAEFTAPDLNADGTFGGYELRGCADDYVVGVGLPVARTDWTYLVLKRLASGWGELQRFPVGLTCGESGLPDAVDELIGCVPTAPTAPPLPDGAIALHELLLGSGGDGPSGEPVDALVAGAEAADSTTQWVGCSGSTAWAEYPLGGRTRLTALLGPRDFAPADLVTTVRVLVDGDTVDRLTVDRNGVDVDLTLPAGDVLRFEAQLESGTCVDVPEGFLAWGNGALSGGASEPESEPVTVEVDSRAGWVQAPVVLEAGRRYAVRVSGSWTVDYRNFAEVGPAGYDAATDATIYPGCRDWPYPYGTLLGRVGTDGGVVPVGDSISSATGGPLFLRINDADSCLVDNQGALTVVLES